LLVWAVVSEALVPGVEGLTGVAWRVVPELVAAVKRVADADPTAGRLVLPAKEKQLDLEGVCVGVAGVGRLEEGPRVATAGHEQLGGVVNLGELGTC